VKTLGGRVTLAAVAAVGLALLAAGVAVALVAAGQDRDALDRELTGLAGRRAGAALRVVAPPGPPGAPGARERGFGEGPPVAALEPNPDRFVRLLTPRGGEIVAAGATVPSDFPSTRPGPPRTVRAGGEDWRVLTEPLPGERALQVAARLAPLQARAARLRNSLLLIGLLALAAVALAAGGLVRVALAPLDRLRATARRVAETADPSVHVEETGSAEEVRSLAADFDLMLARLAASGEAREDALAAARRFAADAGHELRTPLTSLEANLAALGPAGAEAARPALAAARSDANRLAALVEQLQALARGEAGPAATLEEVDLAELADSALAGARGRHPALDARLEAPDEGPVVRGDADGLRRLIDNLVENAARHGRPDGRVVVSVARHDGRAELAVDDDGPGVPVEERARVLERFVRGAGARGEGSGLGLAIAAAQAHRHGGELELDASELGGLRACVALPLG
jgi:signal transduction histidine kinase